MPIIKSASKKMRQDKKRTQLNKSRKRSVKNLIDEALKKPTTENIKAAQSAVDKLAKVKVIHKNKAARIKSRLAKLGKKSLKTDDVKKVKKPKVKSTK